MFIAAVKLGICKRDYDSKVSNVCHLLLLYLPLGQELFERSCTHFGDQAFSRVLTPKIDNLINFYKTSVNFAVILPCQGFFYGVIGEGLFTKSNTYSDHKIKATFLHLLFLLFILSLSLLILCTPSSAQGYDIKDQTGIDSMWKATTLTCTILQSQNPAYAVQLIDFTDNTFQEDWRSFFARSFRQSGSYILSCAGVFQMLLD